MLNSPKVILPVAVALVGLSACGDGESNPGITPPAPQQQSNIVELAAADGRFTTLVGALQATGLDAALSGDGPFTVFAPTDDAFGLLPDGLVEGLDNDTLSTILTYHVAAGRLMASDVIGLDAAPTLADVSANIAVRDGTVVIDGRVQVTQTDIAGSNGIIHVIDAVMIPGDFPGTVVLALVASPRYSTLVGAVVAADLAGALSAEDGSFTVFAPSNDGFARLPDGLVESLDIPTLTAILTYHVLGSEVDAAGAIEAAGNSVETLQGGEIFLQVDGTVIIDGRSQVEYTDIRASNGIIHILDSVLVPGDFPGTIVDALASYPRFDTLVGAVAAQGLAGTLSDESGAGFTVFAPTQSAFAPVDLGAFTGEQLTSILTYHVLGEPKDASAVVGSSSHTTVQGSDIMVDASMGVMLNDDQAAVTFTDINASNGIIHVIDGVLVPSML